MKVWLREGDCFPFTVHIDPGARRISSIDSPAGPLSVPQLPKKCQAFSLPLKPGMTRAALWKESFEEDGGGPGMFGDRYFRSDSVCGPNGEVLMVDIAFHYVRRPSPAIGYVHDPKDIVTHISPAYVAVPEIPGWGERAEHARKP